eukprot:764872-Hanusia_phi.AAC.3
MTSFTLRGRVIALHVAVANICRKVEQAEVPKGTEDCEASEPSTKNVDQSGDVLENFHSKSNHSNTAEPCKEKSKKKTSLWERSRWKGGRRMAKRNAQTSKSHFAAYDRLCMKQFGIGAKFDGEMCACQEGYVVKVSRRGGRRGFNLLAREDDAWKRRSVLFRGQGARKKILRPATSNSISKKQTRKDEFLRAVLTTTRVLDTQKIKDGVQMTCQYIAQQRKICKYQAFFCAGRENDVL